MWLLSKRDFDSVCASEGGVSLDNYFHPRQQLSCSSRKVLAIFGAPCVFVVTHSPIELLEEDFENAVRHRSGFFERKVHEA